MPSARTEVAVAEVGGKIYVVGGFGGERELEIYDPAANRWSRGASIPRELHHAAAVGWQEKLYVVGGFVEGWTPTDDVHEYDPASDRWKRLAALPTPRGALAAAVLGGKVHADRHALWLAGLVMLSNSDAAAPLSSKEIEPIVTDEAA